MFAKFKKAVPLIAIFIFLSASYASAADDGKPGFHGWGDSQEATSAKKAPEAAPQEAEKKPAPEKKVEKSRTDRPEAKKARRADDRDRDRVREKIRKERRAFFEDTKSLRQEIYQKKLELRSELAKKKPSARRAKALHKDIAKMQSKLGNQRIEHFLELKKIDPEMNWRGFRGQGRYGGCQGCPYQGRGYGRGHHMMGPGYGPHHTWEKGDNWQPPRREGERREWKKKKSSYPTGETGNLSEAEAIEVVRAFLKSTRDLNLQVGELSDAGDAYRVDIMTRSGSVFDRVLVDKQNGHLRPVP
jgi:hypothetical protein